MKKHAFYISALVVLLLLGGTGWTLAAAPGYALARWTVDGGGSAPHTTGSYALNSTTGQPDAHTWSGGAYTLNGGFWGGGTGEHYIYLPLVIRE